MSIRQERIRELIRNHLSLLLMTEVTDPALQGITITDVKVDREIVLADVYVHALGEDEREQEVLEGLKRANGFLRRGLANSLDIKNTPSLNFHWDRSLARADHIESILDALKLERGEPLESKPKIDPEDMEGAE